MKCAGCNKAVRPTDGWVSVAKKRVLDLNSHGELETEYAFVACSWECMLAFAEEVYGGAA